MTPAWRPTHQLFTRDDDAQVTPVDYGRIIHTEGELRRSHGIITAPCIARPIARSCPRRRPTRALSWTRSAYHNRSTVGLVSLRATSFWSADHSHFVDRAALPCALVFATARQLGCIR